MFTQFRSRYPTGSLISELLAIAHGKYVVRVLVEVDGVIISSGLAAADTVELAEDQARKRSIQVLGIETSTALPNFPTTRSLSGTENSTSLELNSAPELAQLPEASSLESGTEIPSSPSELEDWSSEGTSSDDWLSATYINPASPYKSPTTEASTKGKTASLPPLPETPAEESNEVPTSSEETSAPTPSKTSKKRQSKTVIESTDFSSEITRTNLELKRLGWTTEQGVEHLQKTYGKRSRHQLTEDELLDFLHYLECLPTPTPQEEI